jgi:hypothetical protein
MASPPRKIAPAPVAERRGRAAPAAARRDPAEPAPAAARRDPAEPAPLVWNPGRSLVFAAGLTEFAHQAFADFDKSTRYDDAFVATLRARGVPPDRCLFFMDRAATQGVLHHHFAAHVARAVASDTLIFFFSGHGTRDDYGNGYLVPYDGRPDSRTQWSAYAVIDTIARYFHGFAVLFFLDACYSGAFGKALADRPLGVPWACLSAAMSTRPTTAASYFAESLVDAFGGRLWVDRDGDGSIVLEELAEHIADELAFTVGQLCSFSASDPRLRQLRLAVASTPRPDPNVGRRVIARDRFGKWVKARIEEVQAGQYLVHYVGFNRQWDEWVRPDQINSWAPVRYRPGAIVQGKSERGRWMRATVVRELRGVHLVRFVRNGAEEWLAPERIRPA